jgi:hypothetical protein
LVVVVVAVRVLVEQADLEEGPQEIRARMPLVEVEVRLRVDLVVVVVAL